MIKADCHIHSHHSGDSESSMESMIDAAISAGLDTICFTEHNDFSYPVYPDLPEDTFLLNADSYLYELLQCKEKYEDRIRILFGTELGMQPETMREDALFAKAHEYDFIIGSVHVLKGEDPYYPQFWDGKDPATVYREYFEATLQNIKKHSNFDVLGHLDYIVRYGNAAKTDKTYSTSLYLDILEAILQELLDKGKGLELNTGGIKSGMKEFHPCDQILKMYRDMGGEIITIGSDAHNPEHVGEYFERATAVLKEAGFEYYAVYEKRNPEFRRL